LQEILALTDVVNEKKTMFGHEPNLRFDVVMADRTYELLASNDQTKVHVLQTRVSLKDNILRHPLTSVPSAL
jgi:hypothetical protein